MDPSFLPLPPAIAILAWIAALPLLALACVRARWRDVDAGPMSRVWPAAVAALVVLWCMRGRAEPSFAFHLSGVAAFTLACGPWLALTGGAAAVAATFALGGAPWANAALAWLVTVAIPVGIAFGVLRATERLLPANYFVYAFVAAAFGAAAAYVVAGAAGIVLLDALRDTDGVAFADYAIVLVVLAIGEAMLTGMALSAGAVYRPAWVATFDAKRYFGVAGSRG